MIRVAMTGVYVDDVPRAHAFYTDVLGFETRTNVDVGGGAPFVTVGAAGGRQDVELLLEPGGGPIAEPYRRALYEAGIPAVVFSVDDLRAEYDRLRALEVGFPQPPGRQGPVLAAILDDTVGNLIQLMEAEAPAG
ncbi:VOC family protein [Streptomyces minutiscleroticus]|uniref:VOC domain-containing protein n=1 Tax=Streptomyces minutiscleroticus TaxID=68238 RepID=A0A918K873_9ACTN|nr:VOC family protein [Streptomyces minutiscleroticus]GGX54104.1 hypothetical protein GCM10010358_05120 [Streptomyces minutiscleroticus]